MAMPKKRGTLKIGCIKPLLLLREGVGDELLVLQIILTQPLKSRVNKKEVRVSNRFNGLQQQAVNLSNIK